MINYKKRFFTLLLSITLSVSLTAQTAEEQTTNPEKMEVLDVILEDYEDYVYMVLLY